MQYAGVRGRASARLIERFSPDERARLGVSQPVPQTAIALGELEKANEDDRSHHGAILAGTQVTRRDTKRDYS